MYRFGLFFDGFACLVVVYLIVLCFCDFFWYVFFFFVCSFSFSVWPYFLRFCLLSIVVFYRFGPLLYRFGFYSIGLACTLSVWLCTLSVGPVLYRFGLYCIGVLYRFGPVLYRFGPVLYRFGFYSNGFVCTLLVYSFGLVLYFIVLCCILSVLFVLFWFTFSVLVFIFSF